MDKIKILALGGLDEDGKDLYVVEINDNIFVIGGGFKYPSKTTPGIDFIIADFSYITQNKDKVKAFILPKCKKNSFGAIPYIYKEVQAPIICTEMTKVFLEEFTKEYQQECNYKFKIIGLPDSLTVAGIKFQFFGTCASMPSTFGFAIRTDKGNIVYSSDFIVEYASEQQFRLDLNTLGKIAEHPTLVLMSESVNASKPGYCSPNHRLYPRLVQYMHNAPGRFLIALNNDNLYHIDEFFRACKELNRKVYFYDDTTRNIYSLIEKLGISHFPQKNIISKDDVLRIKSNEVVVVMSDEKERIYEKVSMLANYEADEKLIKIEPSDTFYLAATPSDNSEIIATETIDELYKTGCFVRYETRSSLAKMHAYEEDLKMLLSLLKPKYYFPIEGYYVNLLDNAKIAFDMNIGLSHSSIFLLDNGQNANFDENGNATIDFNLNDEIKVGDVMIDGIGVGDVVNEIISDRNRLGEDGVVVLGCAISKESREIIAGPDIQMRGFLFLKDKDAEIMLKDITSTFTDLVNSWVKETTTFSLDDLEGKIEFILRKMMLKNNRNPVIKPNIIII